MAWIESHQELGAHPKTRKLAAMLEVPRAQVVGHLHMLWWWALDYAEDGDLSHFDATDIALAAEWEGDAGEFLDALTDCGPGNKAGFVDEDMSLHDWHDYAGKLVERRRKDRERKQEARQGSSARPKPVRGTSSGRRKKSEGVHEDGVRTQPNPTVPNRTEPDSDLLPSVVDHGSDAKPRRRDEIWDTLLEVGFEEPTNDNTRGRRNKAVMLLRQSGATPEEISRRVKMWPLHFEKATLTDMALANRWDELGRPPARATGGQVRQLEREMSRQSQEQQIAEAMGET